MERIPSTLLNVLLNIEEDYRFIVGIDGLSCSGKTTIVNRLRQKLNERNRPVYIFHMDNHIVEQKERYNTGNEEWFEYYNLQWDVEWLKDHLFKKLRISNHFTLPFYDGKSDTQITHNIEIPSACIIIIEGIFIQRKEWRSFFDYVIYLECSRKKRFLRESVETQNNIEKFKNRYWKAEEYYFKTESPLKQADLVIRNY